MSHSSGRPGGQIILTKPRKRSHGLARKSMLIKTSLWTVAFAACCVSATAAEQDADALAKQLANPVAALISVPLQFNWDTGLAANGLGDKFLLNVQPVIPVSLNEKWNVISRTIVPLAAQSNVVPGDNHQSGLGDTIQSLFFSPKQPISGWIVGAGPAIL